MGYNYIRSCGRTRKRRPATALKGGIINEDHIVAAISCAPEMVLSGKSGNFDLIYRVEGEEDIVLNITIESF